MLFAMEGDRFLEVLGPGRGTGGRRRRPGSTAIRRRALVVGRPQRAPLADVRIGSLRWRGAGSGRAGSRIRPGGERLNGRRSTPSGAVRHRLAVRDPVDGRPAHLRGRTPCCVLRSLRLCHPDAAGLSAVVTALGLIDAVIEVEDAVSAGLSATIEGPAGTLELATPGLGTPGPRRPLARPLDSRPHEGRLLRAPRGARGPALRRGSDARARGRRRARSGRGVLAQPPRRLHATRHARHPNASCRWCPDATAPAVSSASAPTSKDGPRATGS